MNRNNRRKVADANDNVWMQSYKVIDIQYDPEKMILFAIPLIMCWALTLVRCTGSKIHL
jgi:hypothetical protein